MGVVKGKKDNDPALLTQLDQPALQAVIFADSFLTTFQPLSLDHPKVLSPLNNVALIHYPLDTLASNGCEQVFVICTNDEVEEYLQSTAPSTWQGRMSVECIKDTSLTNAGDSLRELYRRNLVQSDPFLILFGDVVSNMNLAQALEQHKELHVQDSACVMTLVLAPTGTCQHPSSIQSAKNDLVVAYDESQQNRLLLYDNQSSSKSSVELPCSFFAAHPGMTVRTDLMDTGVFICSPDVLGRFEDEFDYLDIAQDFITNSVAEEEEGLQTRIHAHILSSGDTPEYAARVVDWATYHAVSKDLLRRWAYPIVADNLNSHPVSTKENDDSINNKNDHKAQPQLYSSRYPYYLYKESLHPSKIARSSQLKGPSMLGSQGHIQDSAVVQGSVVGHHVEIGAHAVVQDSHLWDGVCIQDHAKVSQSILAKNVIVKRGAVVSKCVIGEGCVIGENVVLPEYTRITLQEDDEDPFGDDEDDDQDWGGTDNNIMKHSNAAKDSSPDTKVVGKDGKGRVWLPSLEDDEESDVDEDDDDDDEMEFLEGRLSNLHLQSIGTDLTTYFAKRLERQAEAEDDLSEGGLDDGDDKAGMTERQAFAAFTEGAFTFGDSPGIAFTFGDVPGIPAAMDVAAASAPSMVVGRQKGVDVVKELKEICMEFDDSGNIPMENLAIELNSYKFSQNATYSDCTMASILAIIDKMDIGLETTDGKLVAGIKHKMEFWAPLLRKMSIGQPEEQAIIHGLERAATATTVKGGDVLTEAAKKLSTGLSFRLVLQTLHNEEVLSEEAILGWAELRKSESERTPVGKLFRLQAVQDFLEWLEEDSSDDDASSSGEDEDSD